MINYNVNVSLLIIMLGKGKFITKVNITTFSSLATLKILFMANQIHLVTKANPLELES